MADLDSCISLEPGMADAYWHRHLVRILQGDTRAALENLSTMLKLNKKNPCVYRSRLVHTLHDGHQSEFNSIISRYALGTIQSIQTFLIQTFLIQTFLIQTFLIQTFLIQTFLIQTFLIQTFLIQTFLIQTFLIQTFLIQTFLIQTFLIQTFLMIHRINLFICLQYSFLF